jgi:phosphate acyltransferase
MNIGIDMMGGDFAPLEAVKGLRLFLQDNSEATVFCIGQHHMLASLFAEYGIDTERAKIIDAPEVIGYHEHPTKALKEKQQSSIAIGFHLLATGKTQAFISAGNTGAMLVGALYSIKAIEGVQRPTIATVVPKLNGSTGLLLDAGLNTDCKPEHLNQFATLAAIYAQEVMGINEPTVALVNIGEEEGKGNLQAQATYPLLKENTQIKFIGNTEGRDFFTGTADVFVCDGFTGNVVLKLAESVYDIARVRGYEQDEYFNRFHYANYGGTPVLGVAKPVIIGHGISNDIAFMNMIKVAEKMIATDVCNKMKKAFTASGQ